MKAMVIGGTPGEFVAQDASRESRNFGGVSEFARCLVADGHGLIVCSPYEGSADYAALQGIAEGKQTSHVEIHYPDTKEIRQRVNEWVERLPNASVDRFPHHPPETDEPEALQHAWLLSQLSALDRASALVAIGGRIGASAELLLKLAHNRRRLILPLTSMGGASARFFEAHRYEYDDAWGRDVPILHDANNFHRIPALLSKAKSGAAYREERATRAFVSYARPQAAEADFVEMTLRRRGIDVVRDEATFEPGHAIPDAIRENIFSSSTFVALWSADYACSPWCFDEIEIALDRLEKKQISLWILQIDGTRIVPPRARDKLSYPATNRDQLKSVLESLLSGRSEETG